MITLVTVVHIIVSIGLSLVVLLQTGKGADIGAVFGGSSSTLFGSSGAGNFLARLTTGMAVVFMFTSLTLGYFAGRKPSASIFDSRPPGVGESAESQPGLPGSATATGSRSETGSPAVPTEPTKVPNPTEAAK
jgi:preprotein translocase subunit SecG